MAEPIGIFMKNKGVYLMTWLNINKNKCGEQELRASLVNSTVRTCEGTKPIDGP